MDRNHGAHSDGAAGVIPNARGLRAIARRELLEQEQARVLREARASADVDQDVLADAAGVDASYISRQESRRCKDAWGPRELLAWLLDDECHAVGETLLTWMARRAGYRLVRERPMDGTQALFSLLGDAVDAGHAVQRAMIDAASPSSDGGADITHGEREVIRAKARELVRIGEEIEHAANQGAEPASAIPVRLHSADGGRRG